MHDLMLPLAYAYHFRHALMANLRSLLMGAFMHLLLVTSPTTRGVTHSTGIHVERPAELSPLRATSPAIAGKEGPVPPLCHAMRPP